MSGIDLHGNAACPCGTAGFPLSDLQPAGLSAIATGSAITSRSATGCCGRCQARHSCTAWQPGAEGDLAVQMVEWWAYLADILTFYNERIANEAYPRHRDTARERQPPRAAARLSAAPGAGRQGHAGGAAGARTPAPADPARRTADPEQARARPAAAGVRARPSKPRSIARRDCRHVVQRTSCCSSTPPRDRGPTSCGSPARSPASSRATGYLLINTKALTAGTIAASAWITVSKTSAATDPLGAPSRRSNSAPSVPAALSAAAATNYVLLRAGQSAPLWGYPGASSVLTASSVDLASVARQITAGSPSLLDVNASGQTPAPVTVTNYRRAV